MESACAIKNHMIDLQAQLSQLQKEIETQRARLLQCCPHAEFVRDETGDYHRPRTYYVCTCCGYTTWTKPTTM